MNQSKRKLLPSTQSVYTISSKVFWSLSVSIAGIFMISEKKIVKWQTSRNERCDSISRKNNLDLQKNLFGQWKVRTNFESKHTKIATFHTISSKVFRSLSVSVADKFMMSKKIFKMKLGFFREIPQILQV